MVSARSSVAVLTDYRGLTVKELTAMRRRLAENSVEYHVAKNTLTRIALERQGRDRPVDYCLRSLRHAPVPTAS